MRHTFGNRKIRLLLLTLVLIGIPMILSSCITVSPDTMDKIKSEAQNLQNKLKQELETGIKQTDVQLTPTIATVQYIGVDLFLRIGASHNIFVTLKPTNIAVADKRYVADLYEKGTLRESIPFVWNQPEINVLKEKVIEFSCTQQEFDAYTRKDISHIFSVKVHE